MDLIEINYSDDILNEEEECNMDTPADHLLSPGMPGEDDNTEEQPIPPRLGDIYQVEIPPLITGSECLQLSCNNVPGVSYSIGIGLAIPITWSYNDHMKQQEIQGFGICADIPGPVANTEYSGSFVDPLECHKVSIGCIRLENRTMEGQVDAIPFWQLARAKDCIPLPGAASLSWTSAEFQSFLLGLYIFGKNLSHIRKFMENKGMGDLLSFYYGKFYRSDAYRRWSECRKMRSRRCIYGSRIFTGWRQQELLSRLLPGLSQNLQDSLLEAVKAFNEGRASLEEFVLSLKAMVGVKVIVEAVGIGKGRHDLTGIALDPNRINQAISLHSDIPVGKACSSLSTGEIIKFLTGNFRLSKAKSNDLFWEAVWPRLLARGWHSEQPKDLTSVSKNALVFLVPGVKKFSRRKLVKGNQYFDSVSDVLNKVASDPRLIELEIEGVKGNSGTKDEYKLDAVAQLKQKGLSEQHHSYLRPRVANCNSEAMKFTIVDTSWDQGGAPRKVRELRSLPLDPTYNYSPSESSGDTDSGSSSDQPDSGDVSFNDQVDSNPGMCESKKMANSRISTSDNGTIQSEVSHHFPAFSNEKIPINGHDLGNQSHNFANEKKPFEDMTPSSWQHNYLAPVVKRRRLNAYKHSSTKHQSVSFPQGYQVNNEEINFMSIPHMISQNICGGEAGPSRENSFFSLSGGHHVMKEESPCDLRSLKRNEDRCLEADQFRRKKFSCSAEGSPEESKEYMFGGTGFASHVVSKATLHQANNASHNLFDLNVPYLPQDIKAEERFCMGVTSGRDNSNTQKAALLSEKKPALLTEISDNFPERQDSTTNGRRQSTRNRPLTTKALEAFASGFFNNSRGRGRRALPSRSSRRTRRPAGAQAPAPTHFDFSSPNGLSSNVGVNNEYGIYTSQANIFSDCHDQTEGKGVHDSIGVP